MLTFNVRSSECYNARPEPNRVPWDRWGSFVTPTYGPTPRVCLDIRYQGYISGKASAAARLNNAAPQQPQPYSRRNASIGSSRAARRAGK
jgi:hypothetical protein